jgi:hypothetical protein
MYNSACKRGDGKKHFRSSWISAFVDEGLDERIVEKDGKLIKKITYRLPHDFRWDRCPEFGKGRASTISSDENGGS